MGATANKIYKLMKPKLTGHAYQNSSMTFDDVKIEISDNEDDVLKLTKTRKSSKNLLDFDPMSKIEEEKEMPAHNPSSPRSPSTGHVRSPSAPLLPVITISHSAPNNKSKQPSHRRTGTLEPQK